MKRVWALAALAPLAAWSQASAPPTFKVDVKLVRLLVTVKDSGGQLVGSLNSSDFSIFDCGVKQEIAVFDRETALPLSVSMLVDTSGSTKKDLKFETASIEKFFNVLLGKGNPKDAASLYSFSEDVTLHAGFTRRQSSLTSELRSLHAESGTSLYDAIGLASRGMRDRDGRHVIVVVTDGGDTTSRTKIEDALEAAQLADAVVYPILVVPVQTDAGRNIGGEHALTTLAQRTGGRVFEPSIGSQLDQAFADIINDLRTQYMIGYYPRDLPKDAPRFHPVRIELKRPDLRPQARNGYYGDAPR
jgi:Ca-activated chloride channel family protein